MTGPDYPALCASASAASAASQRVYLNLTRSQFAVLATAAALGGWPRTSPLEQRLFSVASLALLLAVTGVSISLRIFRPDDRWFASRALAENIKSAVWRYIMKPAPMADVARASLDEGFLSELRDIRNRFPERTTKTAAHLHGGQDITPWMRGVLGSSFEQKRAVFRRLRMEDQLTWYAARARDNAGLENRWMSATILLELVAVLAAALNAGLLLQFNPVPGLAALASGVVGWTRTKRYSDLANSYTVAAEDLRQLCARAEAVVDELGFAKLVEDVETAVSREHSMWIARRAS